MNKIIIVYCYPTNHCASPTINYNVAYAFLMCTYFIKLRYCQNSKSTYLDFDYIDLLSVRTKPFIYIIIIYLLIKADFERLLFVFLTTHIKI